MPDAPALSILMISTEAVPFAKAGGLAEAVPPLAIALASRGHDVRIVLPRYYFVDRSQLTPLGFNLQSTLQGELINFQAFRGELPNSAVPVYFIEAEAFFGRDGIYGDAQDREFADNARRFAFFGRACFALCRALAWIPDIIQAHDWPAGPAMAYLALDEQPAGFERTKGIFTIHNIAFQGLFPADDFRQLDLGKDQFAPGSFEFFGRLNFMQGAIRHCRAITTVSPNYAREITSTRFGFGLEGILLERQADLHGILNGLDYHHWDPSRDPALAASFEHDRLAGKSDCKQALQASLGLASRPTTPLIGIVSRLISQKGFVEMLSPAGLPHLLANHDVQIVVIGSGEAWCEQAIWTLSRQFPNLAFHHGYAESLVRQILAGSDFLLMPSLIEPCGLAQLAALRYGAIPLVSPLGGLSDTIRFAGQGQAPTAAPATGLVIKPPISPDSIRQTVTTALECYRHDADGLQAMRQRGMCERFGWDEAAQEYEQLFIDCLKVP